MVLKFNFLSKELKMQTNVTVCLPSFSFSDSLRGKSESYVPGTKFQTIYLLHGGFGDDSDYVNFSNITRYADEHKVAVIMPCGYNSLYANSEEGAFPAYYWNYIFEELPRVCEMMFPLSAKREDTFVAGLSMGGHGALKMAIHGCERYAAALIMSGLGYDEAALHKVPFKDDNLDVDKIPDQIGFKEKPLREQELYLLAKQNVEKGKILPKIFMTCGGDDTMMLAAVHQCRNLLLELGYDLYYEEIPGYQHEWDFWDLALRKALDEWLPLRHDVILPE